MGGESMANAKTGDLPMGIDLVILSDPVTVQPVASWTEW